MKLPRDLTGAELVKMLGREYGYREVNQDASAQNVDREDILNR